MFNVVYCSLYVFVIFCIFSTCFVNPETVDPKCIKDKSKPSTGDNVQVCPKTSNFTACCYLNKTWACCPEGDSGSGDLPMIGGILGGITAALIIIVFFWKCCNREQMPCLGKIIDKIKHKFPFLDRRAKKSILTLPKENRKDQFTDDDFHGGPGIFWTDDPFAAMGGRRAIPEPPLEADVAKELHNGPPDPETKTLPMIDHEKVNDDLNFNMDRPATAVHAPATLYAVEGHGKMH